MKRPTWLLNRAVLAAHRRQLAEHGGAPGFDLVRLALALGWPKTVLAFADAQVDVVRPGRRLQRGAAATAPL